MTPWQITFRGHTFSEDDMVGADIAASELLLNDGWESVNPWKSPSHLMVLTAVYLTRVTVADFPSEEEAMQHWHNAVITARAEEVAGMLSVREPAAA